MALKKIKKVENEEVVEENLEVESLAEEFTSLKTEVNTILSTPTLPEVTFKVKVGKVLYDNLTAKEAMEVITAGVISRVKISVTPIVSVEE